VKPYNNGVEKQITVLSYAHPETDTDTGNGGARRKDGKRLIKAKRKKKGLGRKT